MPSARSRRLWTIACILFAALAAWLWTQVAREGMRYGPGLWAMSASVAAVLAFIARSQKR